MREYKHNLESLLGAEIRETQKNKVRITLKLYSRKKIEQNFTVTTFYLQNYLVSNYSPACRYVM